MCPNSFYLHPGSVRSRSLSVFFVLPVQFQPSGPSCHSRGQRTSSVFASGAKPAAWMERRSTQLSRTFHSLPVEQSGLEDFQSKIPLFMFLHKFKSGERGNLLDFNCRREKKSFTTLKFTVFYYSYVYAAYHFGCCLKNLNSQSRKHILSLVLLK